MRTWRILEVALLVLGAACTVVAPGSCVAQSDTLEAAHASEAAKRVVREEAEAERKRQATVKKLLENPKYQKTTWSGGDSVGAELRYHGQPLSQLLHNGAGPISVDALLTLKEVSHPGKPEIINFQLPISYDVLEGAGDDKATTASRVGELILLLDCDPDDSLVTEPRLCGCARATNGDCLLAWNSAFDPPGRHAVQACLLIVAGQNGDLRVKGPVAHCITSNLCQFDLESSLFTDRSATFFAQLVELEGTCTVEIKTRAGKHVKTLASRTTNGIIKLAWNLVDEKGAAYTNNSFVSEFQIFLPFSGRSQTLTQFQTKLGTAGD